MDRQVYMCLPRSVVALAVLVLAGCNSPSTQKAVDESPAPLAAKFDAKTTGSIKGRVIWEGDSPAVEPIKLLLPVGDFDREQPNPNGPKIDSKNHGVQNAIVYLKRVDLAASRPWSHQPVEVAFENRQLVVRQGHTQVHGGIVRRGENVTFLAREKRDHHLDARGEGASGAAYFSLPLVEPDQPTQRVMNRTGVVELSSGRAYYWMRDRLWVGEHPYAAITSADGAFMLEQVPAGTYDLVAWMPNWRINRRERHPEFGEVERLVFGPSVEHSAKVAVAANETAETTLTFRTADFGK